MAVIKPKNVKCLECGKRSRHKASPPYLTADGFLVFVQSYCTNCIEGFIEEESSYLGNDKSARKTK